MENEYPKALYKLGGEFEFEGKSLDMLIVEDAEEEAAARKDGCADLAEALSVKPSKAK